MVFSRTAEYATRAMTYLALQPPGKLTGAREIAEAERIPSPFLWKILQQLARRKLIRSFKGQRGGYELARPPEQITLHTVVVSTDGEELLRDCVLGMERCDEAHPCPLHESWKSIRTQLAALLEQTTLADLARTAQRTSRRKVSRIRGAAPEENR